MEEVDQPLSQLLPQLPSENDATRNAINLHNEIIRALKTQLLRKKEHNRTVVLPYKPTMSLCNQHQSKMSMQPLGRNPCLSNRKTQLSIGVHPRGSADGSTPNGSGEPLANPCDQPQCKLGSSDYSNKGHDKHFVL